MPAIDLVIFDCDGVLVDSEPLANQVLAEHATRFGVPMDAARSIELFVGLSMKSVVGRLEVMAGKPVPDNFLQELQAETFARFADRLEPVRGIAAALDAVEAMGLKTCVASSGGHDKIGTTLGLTGLKARFEGRIFSASEVAHGKPAPDLFLYAAARMGSTPASAVVVEDSRFGVMAGRAAGMTVFGYAADGNFAPLRELGAIPFGDMAELAPLVARAKAGTLGPNTADRKPPEPGR